MPINKKLKWTSSFAMYSKKQLEFLKNVIYNSIKRCEILRDKYSRRLFF